MSQRDEQAVQHDPLEPPAACLWPGKEAIPEWKRREKHHNDINGLFESLGYMRGAHIASFNAAEFWPKVQEMGHDSTTYEVCACRKNGPT